MDPTTTSADPTASVADEATAALAQQAEDAFEAAFNDDGHAPLPVASGDPQEGAATDDPPGNPGQSSQANASDPFASLPPEVRSALARIPVLEHDLSTTKGRLAAQHRELEALRTAPPATARAEAPAAPSVESLELVRGELPEVASAIEDYVKDALGRAGVKPAGQPGETTAAPAAPATQTTTTYDPESAVAAVHPDWKEQARSEEFALWLLTRPQSERDTVNTTDRPEVMVDALTRFKAHRGASSSAAQERARLANLRQQRHADAAVPQGSGARAAAAPPLDEAEAAFVAAFNS